VNWRRSCWQQDRRVLPFLFFFVLHLITTMKFLAKSALALLLVLTPGLALAIPVPPLTPSVSGSTTTATGGPRRPQVFSPSDGEARLGSAEVGGPRRPGALSPEG
jgi:hypothetical protein